MIFPSFEKDLITFAMSSCRSGWYRFPANQAIVVSTSKSIDGSENINVLQGKPSVALTPLKTGSVFKRFEAAAVKVTTVLVQLLFSHRTIKGSP